MKEPRKKPPEVIQKEAYRHFGYVVRALHLLGKKKALTPQIKAIMEALK